MPMNPKMYSGMMNAALAPTIGIAYSIGLSHGLQ